MIRSNGFVFVFVLISFFSLINCSSHAQRIVGQKTIVNLAGTEVENDSIESFLEYQMKLMDVPGLSVAIINNGEVVYNSAMGVAQVEGQIEVTQKSIFEGASLSKPLFAYFVMGFVEDGQLDLDKPLYQYLPNKDIAHDERYKKITARMVLTHTTGFPNWRTDHEGGELFISFEPGTAYLYSGEGYQYLAKVLAHILGTDDAGLERIYQERIALPLNLKYTKYLQDSRNMRNKVKGYRNGKLVKGDDDPTTFGSAFSVHSEAVDFSKWLIALLHKEGLSDQSYDELFRTQFELPADHPQQQVGVSAWTLGFAKATLPFGTAYGHGGNNPGYTSLFMIAPDTNWGFVMFTNADQSQLPMVFLQYLMTP